MAMVTAARQLDSMSIRDVAPWDEDHFWVAVRHRRTAYYRGLCDMTPLRRVVHRRLLMETTDSVEVSLAGSFCRCIELFTDIHEMVDGVTG
jgi:hypothetical protein